MNSLSPYLKYNHYFKQLWLPPHFDGFLLPEDYVLSLLGLTNRIAMRVPQTSISSSASIHSSAVLKGKVAIGQRTVIGPGVNIKGPVIIEDDCELEFNATVGPNCYLSHHCSIGHASVISESLLLEHVQIAGDSRVFKSVLGARSKFLMGATILVPGSTVEVDTGTDVVQVEGFGAVIGEEVTLGINSIIVPGSLIGMKTTIGALTIVSGYVPPFSNLTSDDSEVF